MPSKKKDTSKDKDPVKSLVIGVPSKKLNNQLQKGIGSYISA